MAIACPISASGLYVWYEITDYEIASYEITQRSPTGNPRIVTVHAAVTIKSGYSDEDEEAPPYTEQREIFCYMEFDAEMETWTVEEAEE